MDVEKIFVYDVVVEDRGFESSRWTFEWTTETPTEEGWYWVWIHHPNTDGPVMQFVHDGGMFLHFDQINDEGILKPLSEFAVPLKTSWLGPMPEPERPKEA